MTRRCAGFFVPRFAQKEKESGDGKYLVPICIMDGAGIARRLLYHSRLLRAIIIGESPLPQETICPNLSRAQLSHSLRIVPTVQSGDPAATPPHAAIFLCRPRCFSIILGRRVDPDGPNQIFPWPLL